jgi:hypothetical protein
VNPLEQETDPDPFEIDRVKVIFPYHVVPRIETQASVFTIHPRNEKMEFVAFDQLRRYQTDLRKFIIPSGVFAALKKSLDCFGIHAASLLPDLDGLANRISSCVQ